MALIFKKELMLRRIQEQGLSHLVGKQELAIMDLLDGKEAVLNKWRETVYDEKVWQVTVDRHTYPVNIKDCVLEELT